MSLLFIDVRKMWNCIWNYRWCWRQPTVDAATGFFSGFIDGWEEGCFFMPLFFSNCFPHSFGHRSSFSPFSVHHVHSVVVASTMHISQGYYLRLKSPSKLIMKNALFSWFLKLQTTEFLLMFLIPFFFRTTLPPSGIAVFVCLTSLTGGVFRFDQFQRFALFRVSNGGRNNLEQWRNFAWGKNTSPPQLFGMARKLYTALRKKPARCKIFQEKVFPSHGANF